MDRQGTDVRPKDMGGEQEASPGAGAAPTAERCADQTTAESRGVQPHNLANPPPSGGEQTHSRVVGVGGRAEILYLTISAWNSWGVMDMTNTWSPSGPSTYAMSPSWR